MWPSIEVGWKRGVGANCAGIRSKLCSTKSDIPNVRDYEDFRFRLAGLAERIYAYLKEQYDVGQLYLIMSTKFHKKRTSVYYVARIQLSSLGSTHLFQNKLRGEGLVAGSRVRHDWINLMIPGISSAGTTPLVTIQLLSVSSGILSLKDPNRN